MYVMIPPPIRYAGSIECLWSVDAPWDDSLTEVMPDGHIDLMFNLGEPHRLYQRGGSNEFITFNRCWVSGMRDAPLRIGPTSGTHVYGIRFLPGGISRFLDVPASQFSHSVTELDGYWGAEGDFVCEQLSACETGRERIDVLVQCLDRWAERKDDANPVVEFALSQIVNSNRIAIRELTRELGISGKHLSRLFDRHVGMTPKSVQRVRRFHRSIRALETSSPPDFDDLALSLGFYDQAHFHNDFRSYAGITPVQFLAQSMEDHNFIAV